MKKLIVSILLTCLNILHADNVAFSWRANTEPDLAGCYLYYGPTIGMPVNSFPQLIQGTHGALNMPPHYFAWLTAVNVGGYESDPAYLVYRPKVAEVSVLESPTLQFNGQPLTKLEVFRADETVFPALTPPSLKIYQGQIIIFYRGQSFPVPVPITGEKNFFISFVTSRSI